MGQSTTGIGAPAADPILGDWADPNSGWINPNTTRLVQNSVKTTANGSVIILGRARRPMTTTNAFQEMPNPYYNGFSAWSAFLRQYNADFSLPEYSSIVRGTWDTLNAQPDLNIELHNAFKTADGILVVGKHLGMDNDIMTSNIPSWGTSNYNGESAFIAHFQAAQLENADDSPIVEIVDINNPETLGDKPVVYPNPANDKLHILTDREIQSIEMKDLFGRLIQFEEANTTIDVSAFPAAMYFIDITLDNGNTFQYKILKQ